MLNCNMTSDIFDNDKILKSNHENYSLSQISPENNSLLGLEILPISGDVDSQVSTMKNNASQSTDINGVEKTKENFGSQNSSVFKRKSTISKAERRAEHNAIERARRECLNSKFQQLAEILPNLHHHRRPSKGQIVEKALDWVKQNIYKEDRYHYQLTQLQDENKRLIDQITLLQQKVNNSTTNDRGSNVPTCPVYSHQPFPSAYQIGEPFSYKENYSFYPVGTSTVQIATPEYIFRQNIQIGLDKSQQPSVNDDDNDSSSSDENAGDKNTTYNQSTDYNIFNSNYGIWDKTLQTYYQYPQYQTEPIPGRIYLHNTCPM